MMLFLYSSIYSVKKKMNKDQLLHYKEITVLFFSNGIETAIKFKEQETLYVS